MTQSDYNSFGYWYTQYAELYKLCPRDYLEKEIKHIEELKIKMGRGYHTKLMAQSFAAKDTHHNHYDGRDRDPERDATEARGTIRSGLGRENGKSLFQPRPRQGLDPASPPSFP